MVVVGAELVRLQVKLLLAIWHDFYWLGDQKTKLVEADIFRSHSPGALG